MTEVVSQSNPVEYHIAFSFKPRREHGLLLYVADDDPILGVGLYNGEVMKRERRRGRDEKEGGRMREEEREGGGKENI